MEKLAINGSRNLQFINCHLAYIMCAYYGKPPLSTGEGSVTDFLEDSVVTPRE